MDFFDRQAHARKRTRRLVWLFSLTLLAALVVNSLFLCPLIACFTHPVLANSPAWHPFNLVGSALYLLGEALVYPGHFFRLACHWQPVLWVSLGTFISVAAGCYYKIRELSEGGSVVAEFLGGRRVSANTSDSDERRLRNIVEEMAIASGTPVPEIYVLDCERGINAFAAGHTQDDVAVGVTRGCLKLLTRDELQGVIAHEFSHILNGDTRFNMKLIGLAHGFFWPTLLGRVLIFGTAKDSAADPPVLTEKNKLLILPTAPLGFLFLFLGSFSLPFVRLIKGAICRQREWLADAAAVQFTRHPEGLAGALKKIGGLLKEGRLDTPEAEVASHLYFVNCNHHPWFRFLATHPPLASRITAIYPLFDGNFPKIKMLPPNQAEREETFARSLSNAMAVDSRVCENVSTTIRPITREQIQHAASLRLAFPGEIKSALRTPAGAAGAIYALVLTAEESLRDRQIEFLRASLEPTHFDQLCALLPLVEALDDKLKLPLAEFAVPALREFGLPGYQSFQRNLQQLMECNGSLDLFEYTLMKMVTRQLRAHFEGPNLGPPRYGRLRDVRPECALLLSALAHVGSDNEAGARAAFDAGTQFLDLPREKIEFLTRNEWDLAQVDAALKKLAAYHEPMRRNVLLACGKTVAADRQVPIREAELLRAIADSLDCPMPSFVESIRGEELAQID